MEKTKVFKTIKVDKAKQKELIFFNSKQKYLKINVQGVQRNTKQTKYDQVYLNIKRKTINKAQSKQKYSKIKNDQK